MASTSLLPTLDNLVLASMLPNHSRVSTLRLEDHMELLCVDLLVIWELLLLQAM